MLANGCQEGACKYAMITSSIIISSSPFNRPTEHRNKVLITSAMYDIPGLNFNSQTVLMEDFCHFPWSVQASAGILP